MTPPPSLRRFSGLLAAALAINGVSNILIWPVSSARLAERGLPSSPLFFVLSVSVPVIVGAVLWLFIVRRHSNIARWIYTVMVTIGFVGFLGLLVLMATHTLRAGPVWLGISAGVSATLKIVAAACLFRRDAAGWFTPPPPA